MTDNPMIIVVGTASSGTSMVACVLHHLGVDMGDLSDHLIKRAYPDYEDKGFMELPVGPIPECWPVQEYIDQRRERAKPGSWVGLKNPSFCVLGECPTVELDGVSMVYTHRDIHEIIESDRRITGWARNMVRAANAAERMERLIPGIGVDTSAVRHTAPKRIWVRLFAQELGLDPTDDQIEAAAASINPLRELAEAPAP
jgi:hypothetical protein